MTENQSTTTTGIAALRSLPRRRVAGGVLRIIGAACSGLGFAGLAILTVNGFAISGHTWPLVFSPPFLLWVGLPMLTGGFLTLAGRGLSGRSLPHAVADGVEAVVRPLMLAILIVFVLVRL